MGNGTNVENWAARQRLCWLEMQLWWRGWVGRSGLREIFGISSAQASSDLQCYAELNPDAMSYHMSRKRYESGPRMRCLLHTPQWEEGLALLNEQVAGVRMVAEEESEKVGWVNLPKRSAPNKVLRPVLLAALGEYELTLRYHSISSESARKRVIVPRAFGWDGYRWHTRAWCKESEEWRDFVLGRMDKVEWPNSVAETLPKDEHWEEEVIVKLRLNPKLAKKSQEALRMDYDLKGDVLEIRVRKAMEPYLLASLFLDHTTGRNLPKHFVKYE